MAEQGRVWTADHPQVGGPNLPAAEVAAPNPDLEEWGAVPRPGFDGNYHDGFEDGAAPPRARECRRPLSARLDEEPRPRSIDRRSRRRDFVRLLPAIRRPEDPGRNRLEVERRPQVDRTDIPDAGARTRTQTPPAEPAGLHRAILQPTRARHGRPTESEGDPGQSRRSEEHTSELQSQSNLVCRLLL